MSWGVKFSPCYLSNPHQSRCHVSTEQKQQKIQATQNAKGGGMILVEATCFCFYPMTKYPTILKPRCRIKSPRSGWCNITQPSTSPDVKVTCSCGDFKKKHTLLKAFLGIKKYENSPRNLILYLHKIQKLCMFRVNFEVDVRHKGSSWIQEWTQNNMLMGLREFFCSCRLLDKHVMLLNWC